MATSSTVEDYLKHLFLAEEVQESNALIPMGLIAQRLGVTAGTATSMIKGLATSGLVTYEPRVGVSLTKPGRAIAVKVVRRHRLVECFLVHKLQLDWADVHHEAERLEHALSDRVLNALNVFLEQPTHDPHGDPIPDAQGDMAAEELVPLAEATLQRGYVIGRVLDQEATFLRFLEERGLTLASSLEVLARDEAAEVLTVQQPGADPFAMGVSPARKLLVRPQTRKRQRRVKVAH